LAAAVQRADIGSCATVATEPVIKGAPSCVPVSTWILPKGYASVLAELTNLP
jgi:hypothetical protein